jgi:putative ABC transport system permease protein
MQPSLRGPHTHMHANAMRLIYKRLSKQSLAPVKEKKGISVTVKKNLSYPYRSISLNLKPCPMLKNYIVIALRLLLKNKVFSLINILGISIGISCCILISLYIQDEFNYEKGFKDYQRIFRVNTTVINDGVTNKLPFTSPPIAFGLAEGLPEVETATRTLKALGVEQNIIRYKEKTFFEKNVMFVDSTFLEVFDYKLTKGNPLTALDAPATVLISEKAAVRMFGNDDPMDETIIVNSGQSADTFRITGVVATPTFPSHVDSDFYMSMNSNGGEWVLEQTSWAYNNLVGAYLKLKNPASYKTTEGKFPQFIERHVGSELRSSGMQKLLWLQPLDDVRLYSDMSVGMTEQSHSITYIYIIGTIGIFILLLACINFMNLTTAKSAQRSGEVGIRKSMGANRANLVRQFLGEAMVIVAFSMVVSFLIVALVLPQFGSMIQKELTLNGTNLPFVIAVTVVICIITAVLAGSYPAFFLSALKPTRVLQGRIFGGGSQWLRKGLVVVQFVITISLISSIVIIQKQLDFIQSKSLGFDAEQVVMIPFRTRPSAAQYLMLKESFTKLAGVKEVSGTSSLPSTPLFSDLPLYKEGSSRDQAITHNMVNVDRDYFNALKIKLLAGRDFIIEQDNLEGDTVSATKIIVNESSLKALNIPLKDAVGSSMFFEYEKDRYEFTVVGVVSDFHQFSLHREITPMIFLLPASRNNFNYLAATIDMRGYNNVYTQMKTIWDQRINDVPFETVFLNENVKNLYSAEARTSTIITISTTIALVISCLGLYGLSVYMAERRTKEIGIRKVVGASVPSILGMLSKEYINLILISFIISVPLGYYAMTRWLEGFAYRIEPGVMVFMISGLISFLIAWLTISFESLRAANRNPVDVLRNS